MCAFSVFVCEKERKRVSVRERKWQTEERARAVGHTQPRRESSERRRTSKRVQGEGPKDHQGGRRVTGINVLVILEQKCQERCKPAIFKPLHREENACVWPVFCLFSVCRCVAGVIQPCQECSAACETKKKLRCKKNIQIKKLKKQVSNHG